MKAGVFIIKEITILKTVNILQSSRKTGLALLAGLFVILASLPCAARNNALSDEILVRVKPGKTSAVLSLANALGATTKSTINDLRYFRIKLPVGTSMDEALARFKKDESVEYAGPNHYIHIAVMPNDPVFYEGRAPYGLDGILDPMPQWGLYNDGYNNGYGGTFRADIHASEAWDITTGSASVVIANIDTGVDYTHPDLADKIWINPGETPGNGIDDDHNGFIDDWRGWNFVSNNNDPMDDHDITHGTFTAAISAAASNNNEGVTGVSWGSPILPCKVIAANGQGLESDAAAAVVYAVNLGVKVINMSLSGEDTPALHDAIDYAWDHGSICIVASGNEGTNVPSYPASYPKAMAVGGSNENDQRWVQDPFLGGGGSNYGSYISVVAPGDSITSAGPEHDYQCQSGTSAAAPFVSGVAALLWSVHPTWSNAQIKFQIEHTSDDAGAIGYDIETGWGRVNAYRALTETISDTQRISSVKWAVSGTTVVLRQKVLTTSSSELPGRPSVPQSRLYVQDEDRSSGILLAFNGTPPAGLTSGDRVDVFGTVGIISGERAIKDPVVTKVASGIEPKPLVMDNPSVGGGALGLQFAVVDYYPDVLQMAKGANNIGLLVTTYGIVTNAGYDWFYIDDSHHLADGSPESQDKNGVYVYCGALVRPKVGKYAVVTGISSCEIAPGATVRRRVLLPRRQADIKPQ